MVKEFTNGTKKSALAQKSKKITSKQPAATSSDMFTRLCHSELHAECLREHRFYKPRKWRFDYALPYYKIAVEVEGGVWNGGRHIRPQGFLGDIEKYNTAALLGWRVFRTTPDKLLSQQTIKLLKSAIYGSFVQENSDFTQ